MPRVKIERADVKDHAAAWRDVEQFRKALDKSQMQFARMIGVSPGRYSGWKAQGEMPADIWHEYQRLELRVEPEQLVNGAEPAKATRIVKLPADTYIDVGALLALVEKLEIDRCDVEWCDRAFYRRTWNQRYCDTCRQSGDARRWRAQRDE